LKRFLVISVVWAVCSVAIGTSNCTAESSKVSLGLRPLGFSVNPDQYTLGLQFVFGKVTVMRFAPSVDIGFGDSQTVTTFNLDLRTDLFSPPKANAKFYGGLGPTISLNRPDVGVSDTEIGLSLVAGLKMPFGSRNYYNLETRFGFGDIPDFKLLMGVMFGFGDVAKR